MNEVYSTNTRPRQEEQYLSTVTEMGDRNRLLLQDLFFFFYISTQSEQWRSSYRSSERGEIHSKRMN